MTEKGLAVLRAIIQSEFTNLISHVIIGKDGSVEKDYSEEIRSLCTEQNLPWSYRRDESVVISTYAFAVSWRWLLPSNDKTIIFHDSPLPKYRGFAPLVNQLIQGENEIGVTALFASDEYDKGRIIGIERTSITYPITIQEAINKSIELYSILTLKILSYIKQRKSIPSCEQDESLSSYSLWRDEQDYFIDWTKDAEWIERFVNATGYPYLKSKAKLNGKIIVISKVNVIHDVLIHNRDVGKVIFIHNDGVVVVCGKGLLKIQEAHWQESNTSIFPLRYFRSRFS